MKKIAAILVLAVSVMTTAHASEFIATPIENDYVLNLQGNGNGNNAGLIITRAGSDWQDIPDEALKDDNIIFFDEYPIENGSYDIELPINEKSGLYSVVLGDETGAELENILLMYTDRSENEEAVEKLVSAAKVSKDEMIKTAEENRYELQFYLPITDTVSEDTAWDALYNSAVNGSISAGNGTEAADIYRRELIVNALNSGMLSDMDDYMQYMGITDERIDKWYGSASDDFKNKVAERMNKAEIGGAQEFESKLIEAVILSKVQYPDGYMNIIQILKDFLPETGFSEDIVTTGSCKAVAGKDYDDYNELRNALSSADTNNGQSGGSGGGGGGSSHSSGPSMPSMEIGAGAETETPKPLDVSYFNDLDGYDWAKEAIEDLFIKGIISGRGDGIFAPQDSVTREEFVKMTVLAMDLEDDTPAESFTDADPEAWYAPYITSAVNSGVVTGQGNGIFGIGQPVTRQDMAVMLYRCLDDGGNAEDKSDFTDSNEISDYAADAVGYMNSKGFLKGYEDGSFRPLVPVNRAEAAVTISRILNG